MAWKSVTTFVTDYDADKTALKAAEQLALAADGHLDIVCLGVDPTQPELYFTGATAASLPNAMLEAENRAETLKKTVEEQMAGSTVRWSTVSVATPIVGVTAAVSNWSRFADIVVAGQPYGQGREHLDEQIVEAAMFGGNATMMIVPISGLPQTFDKIVLAWNDSPEALRAARAALPVMQKANSTNIAIIDPPRHGADRSDPGGLLAQMLARQGVRADISILARTMPTVAGVLARQVEDKGADLLVMGAYGHSRLRESILGGATRDMLQHASVPVLMVH